MSCNVSMSGMQSSIAIHVRIYIGRFPFLPCFIALKVFIQPGWVNFIKSDNLRMRKKILNVKQILFKHLLIQNYQIKIHHALIPCSNYVLMSPLHAKSQAFSQIRTFFLCVRSITIRCLYLISK